MSGVGDGTEDIIVVCGLSLNPLVFRRMTPYLFPQVLAFLSLKIICSNLPSNKPNVELRDGG